MERAEVNDTVLKQLAHFENESALLFTDSGILVAEFSQEALLPWQILIQKVHYHIHAAHRDDNCLVLKGDCHLSESELLGLGYRILPIRAYLNQAEPLMQRKAMRAFHWLTWNNHSKFCGKCGSTLKGEFGKLEKHCTQCKEIVFPKYSPAVMVLLHRKNELLLARSPHFQPGVYSAIAGFVEIGESAEEAARRETHEELGLHIGDLTYFSSQPWPFPDSFMMAFTSSDPQGDLQIDQVEIEDAKWFNIRNLPKLPTAASISRQLIETTLKKMQD